MIFVSENGMQMEKNTTRSLTLIYYCTITGLNAEIKSHFADESSDLYLKKKKNWFHILVNLCNLQWLQNIFKPTDNSNYVLIILKWVAKKSSWLEQPLTMQAYYQFKMTWL